MAGFRKAKGEQAALKVGIYGAPGSGKTFSALLATEGLSKVTGKRTAFVDTERGTDFYSQKVITRPVHPEAFDFDALYTKSLTEALTEVKKLDPAEYGQIVIDSITHMWEAAIAAYGGRQTSAGTIPMHAWGKIKRPYKELMAYLLSCPMHVFILGREGTEYATDEDTEELKAVGKKMKAEGETPYEPHILIRMEQIKPKKMNELGQVVAFAEKDRTGVLSGRTFLNPTFETMWKPLLPLMGATQAKVDSGDEAASRDAENIAEAEELRRSVSAELLKEMGAKIALSKTLKELKAVGAEITPQLKSQMTTENVQELRAAYLAREKEVPKGE